MSAPEFPRRVSVAEVVRNARCELYEAVRDNVGTHPWIVRWAAAFDFSFKVERDLNASADTTYLIPVQYGGFTLGIQAALNQDAAATYTLSFSIPDGLGRFDEADCDRMRAAAETPKRLLNGEIGLRRWLEEAMPQMEDAWLATSFPGEPSDFAARRKYAGKVKELGYTIEFGVTAEGSLLPSWSLTFPNGRQFKPALDFSASRVVTHKLIVGLTPVAPPGPEDVSDIHAIIDGKDYIVGRRVCVTNNDATGECWADDPALKAQIEKARREKRQADAAKKRAQEVAQKAIEQVITLQQTSPQAVNPQVFRELPSSEIMKLPLAKEVNPALKGALENLETAKQNLEAAEESAQKAEEKLETVESQPVIQVTEEARRFARIRAAASSEAETERRLDQIIQQQLIRDAFR